MSGVTESVTPPPPPWVRDAVREAIGVRELYERLTGGDATSRAVYCPFHANRDTPALELRDRIGRFHCHGCGHDSDHAGFFRAFAALRSVAVSDDDAWRCVARLAGIDLADGASVARTVASLLPSRLAARVVPAAVAHEAAEIALRFHRRSYRRAVANALRSDVFSAARSDEAASWGPLALPDPEPTAGEAAVRETDHVYALAEETADAPPEAAVAAFEALLTFVAHREAVRRQVDAWEIDDDPLDGVQGPV